MFLHSCYQTVCLHFKFTFFFFLSSFFFFFRPTFQSWDWKLLNAEIIIRILRHSVELVMLFSRGRERSSYTRGRKIMKDNCYLIQSGSRKIRRVAHGFRGDSTLPRTPPPPLPAFPRHCFMEFPWRNETRNASGSSAFEGTISRIVSPPFSASGCSHSFIQPDYFVGMLHRLLHWRNAVWPEDQLCFIRFNTRRRARSCWSTVRWLAKL